MEVYRLHIKSDIEQNSYHLLWYKQLGRQWRSGSWSLTPFSLVTRLSFMSNSASHMFCWSSMFCVHRQHKTKAGWMKGNLVDLSATYCWQHLLPHPDSISLAYSDDYIIHQYSSQGFVTPCIYGVFPPPGFMQFKITLNCEVSSGTLIFC